MMGVARLEGFDEGNRLRLRCEARHIDSVPVDVLADDDPSHASSLAAHVLA